ncbi:cell wall hydrolase [Candidatus Woesearchaeota archaeon]|nr:cell wall hydrolase [Candidatus Woesearchaeota archaeon]
MPQQPPHQRRSLARSLYQTIQEAGQSYRRLADPIKPAIDKMVDPAAVFLAGNATLATGIYYARQGLAHLLGDETTDKIDDLLQSNTTLEISVKLAAYGTLFGLANWKLLRPAMRRLWKRRTMPSWRNHAKTWGIITLGGMLGYAADVGTDARRFSRELQQADSAGDYVDVLTSETNLRVLDRYLSGEKTGPVADAVINSLDDLLQFELSPEESEQIIGEEERIASALSEPRFPYTDRVSQNAQQLTQQGVPVTPEQLVYLARVVYFEGAFDQKAGKDVKKIKKGMHGIASVIYNRWKYDNQYERQHGERPFSNNGKTGVFDAAFKHTKKKTSVLWQFTCIRDHPSYFYKHPGKKGWDIYENNSLQVAVGAMNRQRAELAYDALIEVLGGDAGDPTRAALFYQNKRASDKYNQNWEQRGLQRTRRINSHDFYKPDGSNPSKWTRRMRT